MAAVESKIFVSITTFGLVTLIFMSIYFNNDPRMSDGLITDSEMLWWEMNLQIFGVLSCLANIVMAAVHAFLSGKKIWGFFNILFWPLSYIYSWKTVAAIQSKHDIKKTSSNNTLKRAADDAAP